MYLDYLGDGIYKLCLSKVSQEDNTEFSCVLINYGGRIESISELFVTQSGKLKLYLNLMKVFFFNLF